jgi:hypothetical protein
MKSSLKATLATALSEWLEAQDGHADRPTGIACNDLAEHMATAAAVVYDVSHQASVEGAEDPAVCGVEP